MMSPQRVPASLDNAPSPIADITAPPGSLTQQGLARPPLYTPRTESASEFHRASQPSPHPPSYPGQGITSHPEPPLESSVDLTAGLGYLSESGATAPSPTGWSTDELPLYTEDTRTEPLTLARGLWLWGFLCPLLWFLGMCILWIPLRPVEEELDLERAQKIQEMITILRRTELKYAKRCMWALLSFLAILLSIIGIAMAVVLARR
ncbi:hypothetical protein IAU60_006833 [Kwoniella sp. DSM 27419]